MPIPPKSRQPRSDSNSAPTQKSSPELSALGITASLAFDNLSSDYAEFRDADKVYRIPLANHWQLFSFPDGYTALQTAVFATSGKMWFDDEIEGESAASARDSFLRSVWLRRLREKHINSLAIPFE